MKKMKQNKKGILTTWADSSAVCSLTRVDLKQGKKILDPQWQVEGGLSIGNKKGWAPVASRVWTCNWGQKMVGP